MLIDVIKSLLKQSKKLDIQKLPSQGFFYKPDFEIKIKKADVEDIIEYEVNFDKDNLLTAIECIKKIVYKNCTFSNGYTHFDIKSVDIVYIFLEIVKYSMNKEIRISYFDEDLQTHELINFSTEHFKYFNFDKYMNRYDVTTREFIIKEYRFSLPSIGVEDCLTRCLTEKSIGQDVKKWNSYSYDFMFFLGNKNFLTDSEIDNLIIIFNYDLDEFEIDKIRSVVNKFKDIVGYTLIKNGKSVEIRSKLNFGDIWKD